MTMTNNKSLFCIPAYYDEVQKEDWERSYGLTQECMSLNYSPYTTYWTGNCAEDIFAKLLEKYGDEDPHRCQESCSSPGPGCKACTNLEYFHCQRNNSQVCLHPELVCDGHPQCDGGEDEHLELCLGSYLKSGIVDEYATVICTSPMCITT